MSALHTQCAHTRAPFIQSVIYCISLKINMIRIAFTIVASQKNEKNKSYAPVYV